MIHRASEQGELWAYGKFQVRREGPHPSGYVYTGHQHWEDHMTFFSDGEYLVRWHARDDDGEPTGESGEDQVIGPVCYWVPKERWHEITVVRGPGYWFCTFAGIDEKTPANIVERPYGNHLPA
jgi:hypothetical protein